MIEPRGPGFTPAMPMRAVAPERGAKPGARSTDAGVNAQPFV